MLPPSTRVRFAAAGAALALLIGAAGAEAVPGTDLISTVAGTGVAGFSGDGGPASAAQVSLPVSVSADPAGGYLIVEQGNSLIRRVDAAGTISTIAGNGTAGGTGDGGPATSASLSAPNGAVRTASGAVLIADSNNNRIRSVAPDGTITTVAGTGAAGFSGDGGPATAAQLSFPADVAVTPDGGYLIADNDNNRIRKVSADGTISTVAGAGTAAFGGDGGPATLAQINDPSGVSVGPDGSFAIADLNNNRVRLVAADGTISTIAGTGVAGFSGDGGPGTAAQLNGPTHVALSGGAVFVADRLNNRVRLVAADGTITTVAGTGTAGDTGDGGPAPQAQLNQPLGAAVLASGDLVIADGFNNRVRLVDLVADATPVPTPVPIPTPTPVPVAVYHQSVVVSVVSGKILIKKPGSTKFVELDAAQGIPLGSTVDARHGHVKLVAGLKAGGTDSAVWWDGIFRVTQPGSITQLELVEALSCPKLKRAATASAAKKPKTRKLWGDGKGKFSTKGQFSAATVRGTKWLVQDECRVTITRVARGVVAVRDFAKRKTVLVHAGKSYRALPKR